MTISSRASNNGVRDRDTPLFYFFLLLLIWAPLPLGSNRLWSEMALVLISSSVLILWLIGYILQVHKVPASLSKASGAILCLVLFQFWAFIQSVSLPDTLFEILSSPQRAPLFGERNIISLYPQGSRFSFLSGLGLVNVFLLGLLLVNTFERKQKFYMVIIVSCVFQAALGVVLTLGEGDVFVALGELLHQSPGAASGSFVNSNHFAGYLNIGIALGVGLMLSQYRGREGASLKVYVRRVIRSVLSSAGNLRLCLSIMLIGLVMSFSRMGNIAFMFALMLTMLIYVKKNKGFSLRGIIFFASFIVVDSLFIGAWFGYEKLIMHIENINLLQNPRMDINLASIQIISDYFLAGVGAGAYEVIEPLYRFEGAVGSIDHAHNDYFEFLINGGLVGFLLIGLFVGFCVRSLKDAGKEEGKYDYGLVMLLCYMFLHSFVDFNFQIPAFSYTAVTCLAMSFFAKEVKQRYKSVERY